MIYRGLFDIVGKRGGEVLRKTVKFIFIGIIGQRRFIKFNIYYLYLPNIEQSNIDRYRKHARKKLTKKVMICFSTRLDISKIV